MRTPVATSSPKNAAVNEGGGGSERRSNISVVIAIDDDNIEGRERDDADRNQFWPLSFHRSRPIKEVEEDDAAVALEHRSSSPSNPSLSIKKTSEEGQAALWGNFKPERSGQEHTSAEHCGPIIALNDAISIRDLHGECDNGDTGSTNDGGGDSFTRSNSNFSVKRQGAHDAYVNDTNANDRRPVHSRDGGRKCRAKEKQRAAPPTMTTTCHHTLPIPPTPPPLSFFEVDNDERRRRSVVVVPRPQNNGGQKVAVTPNATMVRVRTPSRAENSTSGNKHTKTAENSEPSSHARTVVEEAAEEGGSVVCTCTTFVYDLTDEQDSAITPRRGNIDRWEPLVAASSVPESPVHWSKLFSSGGSNGAKRRRLESPSSPTSSDSIDVIVIGDMNSTTATEGWRGNKWEPRGGICCNDGGNGNNSADGATVNCGGGSSIDDDENTSKDGHKNGGIVISSDGKQATASNSVQVLAHGHGQNNSCDLFRHCNVAGCKDETSQGGQHHDEGMRQQQLQAYAGMQQQRMLELSHCDHPADSNADGHCCSRESGAHASAVKPAQAECHLVGRVKMRQPKFYDLTDDDPMKVQIKEEQNNQVAPVENIAEEVQSSSAVA